MTCCTTDLVIQQGKTFSRIVTYATSELTYKAITAITNTAPVSITATAHGLPNGWRAAVTSVKGMTQLNAQNTPPKEVDYNQVTVVDVNTIKFNNINAADYGIYTTGGYIQYYTPVDLTGVIGRMTIKNKIGGTVLATLTTAGGGVVIDNTAKTIRIFITAAATALYTWTTGVFDLELEFTDGTVVQLLSGNIQVLEEVTT